MQKNKTWQEDRVIRGQKSGEQSLGGGVWVRDLNESGKNMWGAYEAEERGRTKA